MTNQQKFSRLRKILDDASVYGRSIGKLNFDMQCCAPEEGMEQAGEDQQAVFPPHALQDLRAAGHRAGRRP